MTQALLFENVTKTYRGADRYSALRDDVVGVVRRAIGRGREHQAVHALVDVSFDVQAGESIGIIGPNGAGKTTALKLATRITYPTSGRIRVRGRVGALIEVGTGMHPELTGRENINLYGRIIGLSGRDIAKRFDEIVDFAGIGVAVDQPVKQYSSGMQLRLGFSIASLLEPDIFIVDEAIAVGDAGFQYRCVERMSELVRAGTTLVFVSHDMSAIEALCPRVLLLEQGRIAHDGPSREVVLGYLHQERARHLERANDVAKAEARGGFAIKAVTFHDWDGNEVDGPVIGEPLAIRLHYSTPEPVRSPSFVLGIRDGRCGIVAILGTVIDGNVPEKLAGSGFVECRLPDLPLQPQTYELWGEVRGEIGYGLLTDWQRLRAFTVSGALEGSGTSVVNHSLTAPLRLKYSWAWTTD